MSKDYTLEIVISNLTEDGAQLLKEEILQLVEKYDASLTSPNN